MTEIFSSWMCKHFKEINLCNSHQTAWHWRSTVKMDGWFIWMGGWLINWSVTCWACSLVHKYTWTSPDGKTHNQIDHVLVDRRWQSSILYVRSFRGADCDMDHYLVAAKLRERLSVIKRVAQKFDMHRVFQLLLHFSYTECRILWYLFTKT
jgi:hypothetical protein